MDWIKDQVQDTVRGFWRRNTRYRKWPIFTRNNIGLGKRGRSIGKKHLYAVKRQSVSTVRIPEKDIGFLMDDNLYERDILIAAKIMSSSPFVEQRLNAVKDIGHLAWLGGPPVSKFAGNYLVNMMSFISDRSMPVAFVKACVEAIGNICCSSKEARDRSSMLGLVEELCKLLNHHKDTEHRELRMNIVYTILVLVCENRDNQRQAFDSTSLKEMLPQMSKENWSDWPKNEAQKLYEFLGFDRRK